MTQDAAAAAYSNTADKALQATRTWAQGKPLPDDPWKLPKDCPLWHMGLSLYQASWVLARLRQEQGASE